VGTAASSGTTAASGRRPLPPPPDGRLRPVIEDVHPSVEGGRYPAKTSVGELLPIEADVFTEGHDLVWAEVRYAYGSERRWSVTAMRPIRNDRHEAGLVADRTGRYRFQVRAGIDQWRTWRRDLLARLAAGQDVAIELEVGAGLAAAAGARAKGADRTSLGSLEAALRSGMQCLEPEPANDAAPDAFGSEATAELVNRYPDPATIVASEVFEVVAERALARYSTWYELFPRSASPDPERPGTLADVEARLDYVAGLGADILYLPPIHPIGTTSRKGRNGTTTAAAGDPGSPWAIGSPAGGHTAIDPALGTFDDFASLLAAARERGIELALDLAFQCSPDHPWVTEHPEWFRHRPDGTIRYAENPPKKYQDIYPLDFECEAWQELWQALFGIVDFWIGRGVTVFRVDNPHTKPFRFWEWLIAAVHADHPEVIFLAEAFTRPKVMQRLAKLGFTQSYTYFAWRNTKWELEQYGTELTRAPVVESFRPSYWPNTPDILTEALQRGGEAMFVARLVLAATLAASYGIYGPAFELQEHEAREPGSEEYLGSEKYEVRHWDLDSPDSLAPLIARVNAVRRAHPALQQDRTLRFHRTDNDALIAYSKTVGINEPVDRAEPAADAVLVVVNLDPVYRQSGWIELDLGALGLCDGESFVVHDHLTDDRYTWSSSRNLVILDPEVAPAHLFSIQRHPRPAGAAGAGEG
jgi:starch synthase (maltosyl-transferring)